MIQSVPTKPDAKRENECYCHSCDMVIIIISKSYKVPFYCPHCKNYPLHLDRTEYVTR